MDRNAFKTRLENIAAWLENGCDPKHAAQELRLMAEPAVKANEAPADEIRVWECASCKHWTPVSHARCACCGRERAVKISQAKALDEMVKASEDVGGYDLPATPREPSLPTDFNGDPIKPKAL